MTAQQQLASILQYIEETGFVPATTRNFILDHGPAIAELIEAADAYSDDPCGITAARLDAALRKLTQDA